MPCRRSTFRKTIAPTLAYVAVGLGHMCGPGLWAGEDGQALTRVIKTKPSAHNQADRDNQLSAIWKKDILPELEYYCFDCHGDGRSKGKLDLDDYPDLASMRANPKVWQHIQAQVDYHLMPPPDKEQPSRAFRHKLARWIDNAIFPIDPNNPDPGHMALRRLNRVEYRNTIRDLLGVDVDTTAILPPDDSGHGFDTIGSVLTISPAHIEKYLQSAELALDKAIVIGPMRAPQKKLNLRQLRSDGRKNASGIFLSRNGTVHINPEVQQSGKYLIHIVASAHQAGNEPAFIDVMANDRRLVRLKVANEYGDQKTFSVKVPLQRGHNKLKAIFPNDYYDPKARDPNRRDRNLMIHSISIEGPTDIAYKKPASHRRIFIPRTKDTSTQTYVRAVLSGFGKRAFRRPVRDQEIDRYLALAEKIARNNKGEYPLEHGIKGAIQAMLVSPSFLFIGAEKSPGNDHSPTLVSEHTLASRLSYFLWSSMPDQTLLELADRGALRKNLTAQVTRMLQDKRAKQLVLNFSGQWLQLRDLAVITPDQKRFRSFNDDLRKDMRTETEMFLQHILLENQSLIGLLDADYTFINSRLARHYQIKGVSGSHFRKVSLNNSHRRGLLTHASLLTITSQPTRTSPVLRGKFVLENILDITPPPPPPDTQPLQDPQEHADNLSLRQQLAIHREKKACAGCHNLMDPVGLAFEHFDAIGRYRESANGRKINASGKLVTGEPIDNAETLRKIILANKLDEFLRCLTNKMMTYALGRGITPFDRVFTEKILRDLQKSGYRSHDLILGIIHSKPFQHQRP